MQYLVKWKGYPESDNTWEPADHIQAPRLLKRYERRQPSSIKRIRGQPLHQPPNWEANVNIPTSALSPRAPAFPPLLLSPTSPILTSLHSYAPTPIPHTSSPFSPLATFHGMKKTSSIPPTHGTSLGLMPLPPTTPAQMLIALLTTRKCPTPLLICQTNLQHRPPVTPP